MIEIEKELIELNGKGVYFVPEQHIAFLHRKGSNENRKTIFGEDVNVERLHEKKLGEKKLGTGYGGVTHIIFRESGKNIAIELKLRDSAVSYNADVEKLSW